MGEWELLSALKRVITCTPVHHQWHPHVSTVVFLGHMQSCSAAGGVWGRFLARRGIANHNGLRPGRHFFASDSSKLQHADGPSVGGEAQEGPRGLSRLDRLLYRITDAVPALGSPEVLRYHPHLHELSLSSYPTPRTFHLCRIL